MSDSDTPGYVKEPNVNGIWRVDPTDNSHIEQTEQRGRGVYFVGYWDDGRAIVYTEDVHSVFLEPVVGADVVRDPNQSKQIHVGADHIEDWVRNNTDRIAALHPRYYWILEVNNE